MPPSSVLAELLHLCACCLCLGRPKPEWMISFQSPVAHTLGTNHWCLSTDSLEQIYCFALPRTASLGWLPQWKRTKIMELQNHFSWKRPLLFIGLNNKSNHQPDLMSPFTNSCSLVPWPCVSWIHPRMGTAPWTACFNAWLPSPWKMYPDIPSKSLLVQLETISLYTESPHSVSPMLSPTIIWSARPTLLMAFGKDKTLKVSQGAGGRICQDSCFQIEIEDGVSMQNESNKKKQKFSAWIEIWDQYF